MESKSLINLAKSPIGLKIVPTTSLILLVFFFSPSEDSSW
jgi:hypothetical protein